MISKNYIDEGDLISVIVEGFNPRSLDGYALGNIIISVNSFDLDKEFVKICIFDALIANQDRHCEN